MKKTMLLIITLVLTLAVPSAFADSKADQKTGDVPYNGITYFDLGTEATMPETTVAWEPADMPFNGITYFEQSQPGIPTRNSAVSGLAAGGQRPEKKLYNGITVFE
jgi:hypothetical protein